MGTGVAMVFAGIGTVMGEIDLTDLQGRTARVEIVAATPTSVTLQFQGRKTPLELSQLAEASRTAAIDYAKSKGVYRAFPDVKVQVKIAYQRRNTPGSYYRRDMKLSPSIVIEGTRSMEAIPAAEATLVLVTRDTQAKYVKGVEKMEIYATETISLDAGTGARREFSFQEVNTNFDAARDMTNVGGDEYRFYIFGLRDPATRQLIEFRTNCTKLEAYVAAHPEARETVLAARKGAPFSDDFVTQ
jgi:hypothetical protein